MESHHTLLTRIVACISINKASNSKIYPETCHSIGRQEVTISRDLGVSEGGAQAGTAEDGGSTVLPAVLEGHVVKPDLLAGCKLIVTGTLVAKPGTKIVYLLGHGIHVVDSADEFDHIQTVQNFYSAEDIPKFHAFKTNQM